MWRAFVSVIGAHAASPIETPLHFPKQFDTAFENLESLKKFDTARRPSFPLERSSTKSISLNPNCDGPYTAFWDEFRYNLTILLEKGDKDTLEEYASDPPWTHASGPELMECPLAAVSLRLVKAFMHGLIGSAIHQFLTFEFTTLFKTFPVSVWLQSKWGGIITICLTNFLDRICESSPRVKDFCQRSIDEINLNANTYIRESKDDIGIEILANETMNAYLNGWQYVYGKDVEAWSDVVVYLAREILRQGIPVKYSDGGVWGHPFRSQVSKAWRVLDLHQQKIYKKLTDGIPYPSFRMGHFIENYSFLKIVLQLHTEVFAHQYEAILNSPPPVRAVNPMKEREEGDYRYEKLRACGMSNMITEGIGRYHARVIAASVHKNKFVDGRFSVMHFNLWSENTEHTEELMEYGFNRSVYICEPDTQTMFIQLICIVELPNGQFYRSHATNIVGAGWIRPYRQSFECVIPANARTVWISEATDHWTEKIKVELCETERKFKSAICMRSLFDMSPATHDLLETWLHYHLSMGFEHVYMYDHDGTANSTLVQKLVNLGKVTYTLGLDKQFSAVHQKKVDLQMHHQDVVCDGLVMNHCVIQNRVEADWLFMVRGIDKFITSKHGEKTLERFLDKWHPLHNQIGGFGIGAKNFRDDEIDSNPTHPVFLRKRTTWSSDDIWCPIVTPHIHYMLTHNFRPRDGYDYHELDLDEIRVNHYQSAIRIGRWRTGLDEARNETAPVSDEEREPWMGWGLDWIEACRAQTESCPYLQT